MASDDISPGLSPKVHSPEKPKGVSRKKKSASQTEVLERTYGLEKYPSETTRYALSRELNLSEKQLQIWFTHRRYKDRRDGIDDEKLTANSRRSKYDPQAELPGSSKKGEIIDLNSREEDAFEDGYPSQVLAEEHYDEDLIAEYGNGLDVGNGDHEKYMKLKPKPKPKPVPRRSSGIRIPRHTSMPVRNSTLNAQAQAEQTTIFAIENQLGGPLRNDGPPLGVEFDPLPPDAFQQLAMTEAKVTEKNERLGKPSNLKRFLDFTRARRKQVRVI